MDHQELVSAIWPYDPKSLEALAGDELIRFLWPWRRQLSERVAYGLSQLARGLAWFEYSMLFRDRFRTPLSIGFAFVATHNHFILDRGHKVFKQSAPIIKLRPEASEEDHFALLGLLNSSVACFWGRNTFFPKGGFAAGKWQERLEWDGTKLKEFPVTAQKPLELARELDLLARNAAKLTPVAVVRRSVPTRKLLDDARGEWESARRQMIALQEELDWRCYRIYGLLDEDLTLAENHLPEINLGERAFEIVIARDIQDGEVTTTWFKSHDSMPITKIPAEWAPPYRKLVERRIQAIESNQWIRLIERPEHKRRWAIEPWEKQESGALREWMLDRLEDACYWPAPPVLLSCAELADRVRGDREFLQVAELYRGRTDFDLAALITELIEPESISFLSVLRYSESGFRKRKVWESTWELQGREDEVDARTKLAPTDPEYLSDHRATDLKRSEVGDIPIPPPYKPEDFQSTDFWRLRGKLDVPRERFIRYPFCEREGDGTIVIGWAGWNHLEQARGLADYYMRMKTQEGWTDERRIPLIAGIDELVPWLKQWHNEIDPAYQERMGNFFDGFVSEEARAMGRTVEQVRAWTPPPKANGRVKRKARKQ